VIGYFDFPSTDIVPIICKKYNLPSASLGSVMSIENKLWARKEQQKVIKAHIPEFVGFNPNEIHSPSQVDLIFPFWIKPIRSFKSYLAFKITDKRSFLQGVKALKRDAGKITAPFQILMEHAQIPEDFQPFLACSCIAESLEKGDQCTVEGYVYDNEVICYGIVDSISEQERSSLIAYEYPSHLPDHVQEKMIDLSRQIMTHIGYNNATFNIEYFYNPEDGRISLLEINPRCSQSHAPLYEKVDGISNLAVMVDLAMGKKPEFKKGGGLFKVAAKYMVRSYEDGIITRIPDREDIRKLKDRFPATEIKLHVDAGTRLSGLYNQDSYSYELMDIYIGGNDCRDLTDKYEACLNMLGFSMDLRFRLPEASRLQ
jgi:Carbamoyl-phosphate synthase L chain, ATP binding domain